MSAEPWIAAAAAIAGLLGGVHLLMLYTSPKLMPKDATVASAMQGATVPLSDATSMLRLWVGFNASHALGALCFGTTFGYLALGETDVLLASPALIVIGLAYLVAMLLASLRYWFLAPTIGIALAAVLFMIGTALALTG